jgi:hypothetical protein
VSTGRENPRSVNSPTGSLVTISSTAAWTRWLSRICQGRASAHSRAARLVTLPMAV